ncbi:MULTISPECIES: TIGR03086 family metal-binding protein [unclassified Amycolatopsis]|uniref:TIGR03086 family metal-binding protein n=1 Tax=unclassified Amycolatopsis TaxID=2618356 RepID=UPI0028770648|nr:MULTISPECIES: TIGR03086 family metal-binding protein [unclassified Amycolatopsis]MDS0138441.1 TIGR03086 family protein [Amycolatopsis sp. 505]MDS0146282.1 TIGR03086 family protein [Amycolatopsis sp. CM201R]
MTVLDEFDLAASTVTGLVTAVRADQWALPTACAEWDVRAVVNHLAHGNAKVAFWAGTGPPAPDGDYLGASPAAAFAASVASARSVLAAPGLFSRQVTTPLGEVPGVFLVHMRVNEYLAHGWDIADATGQPTDLAPELATRALEQWRSRFGAAPRQPGGPFGPEVPPPPEATPADRLAAFLGRKAVNSWS